MKVSMGQITTLTTRMEDCVPAYAKAGFTRVELAIPTVQKYLEDHTVEEMRALFDANGIAAVSAIGLSPEGVAALYSRGEEAERYFASLLDQLKMCKVMGCDLLNIGSEDDRFYYEGYEKQAIANLKRAAKMAAEYGVKIAFEDGNMKRSLSLVYAADEENLGFCVDFFWFYKRGYKEDNFRIFNYEKLFNLHHCDLPADYDAETMDDGIRVLPGEGFLPLEDWMKWLVARGFDGYCTLELLNQKIWDMQIDEACACCMEAMKPYELI